jgi:hypothetical protein
MATSGKIGEMTLLYRDVEQYFKRLQFHLTATGKSELSKAVFLSSCGQSAFALIETLLAPADVAEENVIFDQVKTLVLQHLKPKQILHYQRHKLHSMKQTDQEIVTTYLQRLKHQVNHCQFGELRDGLLLSHFLFGLRSAEVRARLLAVTTLTLDRAVQEAILHEAIGTLSIGEREASVSNLTNNFKRFTNKSRTLSNTSDVKGIGYGECYSCGENNHRRMDCKFRLSICHACGRKGHIAKLARRNQRSMKS